MRFLSWIGFTILISLFSCAEEVAEDKGAVLVQVYGNALYEKDIENLLTGHESPQDSALVINAYIERWVRNQVMLFEAEKQIEDMKEIDDLVEDYKHSLILYDYEVQLTSVMLDTLVTYKEVLEYYSERKQDFILNQPVIGLIWWTLGSLNEENLELDLLQAQVKEGDFENIDIDSSVEFGYFSPRDLKTDFPGFNPENIPGNIFSLKTDNGELRILVLDEVEEGETAPLPFVRDEIEKLILHRRKIKLLQGIKEENYQKALRKNQIKYFN